MTFYKIVSFFRRQINGENRRKILVVGFGLLLLGIVFFLFFWMRDRRETSLRGTAQTLAVQTLRQELKTCDQEKYPETCRSQRVEEAAQRTGLEELCTELKGDAFENCVWGVALDGRRPEVCNEIVEAIARTHCLDAVWWRKAIEEKDPATCVKLTDEELVQECESVTGKTEEELIRTETLATAVASGDPMQCRALSQEEDLVSCLDAVGTGDVDHDGLEAKKEQTLGTSDLLVDTDGDG